MYQSVFVESFIGPFKITGSELGVRTVHKVEAMEAFEEIADPEHPVAQCRQQLAEYFQGKRQQFDLKLDWSGAPEFQKQVWAELLKIPFGKTASYSDIAERVHNPTAVRAVGLANRNNPVAIIVPCHRVIGKAGELRGYFYGLDTKMLLLRHENPVRFAEQGALFE